MGLINMYLLLHICEKIGVMRHDSAVLAFIIGSLFTMAKIAFKCIEEDY